MTLSRLESRLGLCHPNLRLKILPLDSNVHMLPKSCVMNFIAYSYLRILPFLQWQQIRNEYFILLVQTSWQTCKNGLVRRNFPFKPICHDPTRIKTNKFCCKIQILGRFPMYYVFNSLLLGRQTIVRINWTPSGRKIGTVLDCWPEYFRGIRIRPFFLLWCGSNRSLSGSYPGIVKRKIHYE